MSFVKVEPDSHFPIENLPYGIFSTRDNAKHRIGVAIGDKIMDLSLVSHLFTGPILSKHRYVFEKSTLNDFMALPKEAWLEARVTLQRLLSKNEAILRDNTSLRSKVFVDQGTSKMHLPANIGGYVDFSSSLYHALNCTRLGLLNKAEDASDLDDDLPATWLWCPIGYHGRASSVVVSGTSIRRPWGQVRPNPDGPVLFQPSQKVDFELEMGFLVGGPSNSLGSPIPIDHTQNHIFGMVLVNDWSARDVQGWEQDERGPFVSKNFGTSISPWVVTMEALKPFTVENPVQDPLPAPYLRHKDPFSFNIHLELAVKGEKTVKPETIVRTNFKDMYWTMKQQLAHYTLSGCNVNAGDLMASGTVSGPDHSSYACLLEQTYAGTRPIGLGDSPETRTFLLDHDQVIITGYCSCPGLRLGFGECRGTLLPALNVIS